MAGEKYPPVLKCVIVGEEAVGKTSLRNAFLDGTAPPIDASPAPTIAPYFYYKTVTIGDIAVGLQFWDPGTKGTSRLATATFIQDAALVVLAFDITAPSSFEALAFWRENVKQFAPDAQIILVGTKSDLGVQRQVAVEVAEDWARRNLRDSGAYIEVSATNPVELQRHVITPRLQTVITAPKDSSPRAPGGATPVIAVTNPESGSSSSSFSSLFSSPRAPARTAEHYVLPAGQVNANPHFSYDFRNIFTSLYGFGIMSKRTPVADAVFGNNGGSQLNQVTLNEHAQKRGSRTEQTIAILRHVTALREGLRETHGFGVFRDAKSSFLIGFKRAYEADYNSGIFRGRLSKSAAAVSWIHDVTDSDILGFEEAEADRHISKILCHAVMNPSSRTARIVAKLPPSSVVGSVAKGGSTSSSSSSSDNDSWDTDYYSDGNDYSR